MPKLTSRVSLREIALTFLVIGATGFGGGMAVIALIQEQCVVKRKWLELDEYSHGIAFGQILGPFMVNAATFVGYRLRGLPGAITAAVALVAPSFVLVVILSSLYFRYHQLPALQSALHGIGPVVVALIVSAAYQMGRPRARSAEAIVIAVAAMALTLLAKTQAITILLLAAAYGIVRVLLDSRGSADEA